MMYKCEKYRIRKRKFHKTEGHNKNKRYVIRHGWMQGDMLQVQGCTEGDGTCKILNWTEKMPDV